MNGLFISGTDTGVGKTWIAAGLTGVLRQRGLDVGVWKPVQSGRLPGDADADSAVLKAVSGVPESEAQICPFSFPAALTPALAARLSGRPVQLDELVAGGAPIAAAHAAVVVEGAGGLAVPVADNALVVDLAYKLGLPVVLVARPGLGTINHTLLSIDYARRHGLHVGGVIFNGYLGQLPPLPASLEDAADTAAWRDAEFSNPLWVRDLASVPVLGRVPWVSAAGGLHGHRATVDSHLDLPAIAALCGLRL